LYGPDVLIAKKMEAHGKDGMIQVSDSTKNLLTAAHSAKYRFAPNAAIEIKQLNKTMEGYLVYAQENDPDNEREEETPFKDA
jgi:Adenylate and Guanylate cyclase catalytic domain